MCAFNPHFFLFSPFTVVPLLFITVIRKGWLVVVVGKLVLLL